MTDPILSFDGENRYLSNFYYLAVPIKIDGISYPTVEHAYQAMKTENTEQRQSISMAHSPGRAKRMGREVELRRGWNGMRIKIMTDLVRQKFTCNPNLMKRLIKTGDALLEEGNNWGDTLGMIPRSRRQM